MKVRDTFKRPGETQTITLDGLWPNLTFSEVVHWYETMKTIRHTDTLVYYDGIQVLIPIQSDVTTFYLSG